AGRQAACTAAGLAVEHAARRPRATVPRSGRRAAPASRDGAGGGPGGADADAGRAPSPGAARRPERRRRAGEALSPRPGRLIGGWRKPAPAAKPAEPNEGSEPMTRDAHVLYDAEGKPTRDTPWIFRTYAGHTNVHASNALYRANLSRGQTGLSIAFDLPTQCGYSSDHPLAKPEIGK